MKVVKAVQGDTLDIVVYRHLGQQQQCIVEQCLELNPKLANDIVLNEGQNVVLPAVAIKKPTKQTIQLWS
ncbi:MULTISPECIES: tail protein X [Pasteurellaceae]|uniref:Tail protein X n=1 Tax=Pasteurella atlantica TaxID=2827233 RepID=A0AAW8CSJ4_9PAST|nr:tail protein X [Pasteurella atlantica]MBR0573342.1 tail protein X [Pasteurella atlantica]MDP8040476.1 tail protein X [Pasteurella atlantica]MDP8041867.1 tail protein X [Pasteurella atlantica]MDP8043934.1 tail protein X [Pasteurella atlantica]MDP8046787.1 tail protein X [Pasteurella atlantica]